MLQRKITTVGRYGHNRDRLLLIRERLWSATSQPVFQGSE